MALLGRYWLKKICAKRYLSYPLTGIYEVLGILSMAAIGGLTAAYPYNGPAPIICLVLVLIALVASVSDLAYRIIPNDCILAALTLKIVMIVLGETGMSGIEKGGLASSLIGMAACFLIFAFPAVFGKKVGAGDIKLAAAFGFLLGIGPSLSGIVIMGMLVIGYTVFQKKMPVMKFLASNIPMGPFISAGMFAAYVGTAMPLQTFAM